MWLRRMERAAETGAQWLQSPHTYMPHAIWARHPPAQPAHDGKPSERAQWHQFYPGATCDALC
eukprot:122470-Pyramimonas_sp.AAC.1